LADDAVAIQNASPLNLQSSALESAVLRSFTSNKVVSEPSDGFISELVSSRSGNDTEFSFTELLDRHYAVSTQGEKPWWQSMSGEGSLNKGKALLGIVAGFSQLALAGGLAMSPGLNIASAAAIVPLALHGAANIQEGFTTLYADEGQNFVKDSWLEGIEYLDSQGLKLTDDPQLLASQVFHLTDFVMGATSLLSPTRDPRLLFKEQRILGFQKELIDKGSFMGGAVIANDLAGLAINLESTKMFDSNSSASSPAAAREMLFLSQDVLRSSDHYNDFIKNSRRSIRM
jgi:hypothetical protein